MINANDDHSALLGEIMEYHWCILIRDAKGESKILFFVTCMCTYLYIPIDVNIYLSIFV